MSEFNNLELVRVTEAAAIAASSEVGRGDKIAADHAATCAMRERLNGVDFCGRIVRRNLSLNMNLNQNFVKVSYH